MKIVSSPLLHGKSVTAVFTTRLGGVSTSPYDSANLAFHVGDDSADVVRNHDRLAQMLGYDRSRLVHMCQIHSDRIVIADESFSFENPPECDALITNRPGIALMAMSADCTPILLHDPIHNAIGAVHAGRAGALKEILPKTIAAMREIYGTTVNTLRISLGPSIHGCCYEINDLIADEVAIKGHENALRRVNDRIYLDVNTILLNQLKKMEIGTERIEVIDACTSCKNDTFFSYRADAQQTGRIGGVIILHS